MGMEILYLADLGAVKAVGSLASAQPFCAPNYHNKQPARTAPVQLPAAAPAVTEGVKAFLTTLGIILSSQRLEAWR